MPAEPNKVRIVGGTNCSDTKVVLVATGEEIPNVRKVTWTHEVGGLATAVVEIIRCEIDAQADAREKVVHG